MIHYVLGDATQHTAVDRARVIAHVCNDQGGWGRGFVLAISKRWSQPEQRYRQAYAKGETALGFVDFVPVESRLFVANMVAQHGYRHQGEMYGINYEALEMCLNKLSGFAVHANATIHMPRIGCGLAGGKWDDVEPLINKHLSLEDVYVYDLPE